MKFKSHILLLPFFALLLFACKPDQTQSNTDNAIQVDSTDVKKPEQTTKVEEPATEPQAQQVAPQYFICYAEDSGTGLAISISFDQEGKAIHVKYKGQDASIPLSYVKEDYKEGGAHPTIDTYYSELFNGKVNGEYVLTHSGIWDYVVYTRGSDGKTFNFTINHDLTVEDGEYRTSPCF